MTLPHDLAGAHDYRAYRNFAKLFRGAGKRQRKLHVFKIVPRRRAAHSHGVCSIAGAARAGDRRATQYRLREADGPISSANNTVP